MKDPIKAALYTAGTIFTAAVTLAVGNRICEKREKRAEKKKK